MLASVLSYHQIPDKKQAQFLNLFGPTITDQDHFTEQIQQQLILKWFYEGLVCLVAYVLGNQ